MSYYTRVADGVYRPTRHAGGAWNDDEVHFAPLSALMTHEMDRHVGVERALAFSRAGFDILGFLGTGDCAIRVETIRPGRTIELVEAVAEIGGRTAVRARGWYLANFDTASVAGGEPAPLPDPTTVPTSSVMHDRWTGGFVESLEVRPTGPATPGRASVWLSTEHELIEGVDVSAHAAFLSLVDTANGIAVRQDPREWVFPNVDLTVHLWRQPTDRWVGLDTTVTFGATGHGVTSTVLHDRTGGVGYARQALTVRRVQ